MKKAKGTHDDRSEPIGIHEWELDSMAKAMRMILKEAMEIATKEYKCYAWFAHDWGPKNDGIKPRRKPPADVSTVFVELPLGPNEDDSPRWSFTVTELVENTIGMYEHGDGGYIDDEDKPGLVALRDKLRSLADTIDVAMARVEDGAPGGRRA